MEYPLLQTGDVYITDNWKTGAKIVQFLSTAPTCWHHLFWFLFNKKKLEASRPAGYHYGMVLNPDHIIEQQGKVEINDVEKIFKKEVYVYRRLGLTEHDKNLLVQVATADLGEGYGILECFGKLIAWITGIKYFAKWLDMKDNAICVCRVGEWYRVIGENFGVKHPNYLKANLKERYLDLSPMWTQVYKKLK